MLQGYVVVDNVFGSELTRQLQQELLQLHSSGRMHLNCTHLVRGNTTQLLEKSSIYEAELTLDAAVQQAAPLFAKLQQDGTLQTMLNLFLPQLSLDSHAIKLQYNAGTGGCFPMHFDSDEQLDGRCVTAISYLNEDWQPGFGGQLRLYPFPFKPIDISPIADRLVLFSSTRMLHRVLPCDHPRSCFTIWLSQTRTRRAFQPAAAKHDCKEPDSTADEAAVARFLMQPSIRQHVCRVVYADEWRRSIQQSHSASAARQAALEVFEHELDIIKTAMAKYMPYISRLSDSSDGNDTPDAFRQLAAQVVQWFR
eukprot:jgi/Chrzof1/7178/Cz02g13280.t1